MVNKQMKNGRYKKRKSSEKRKLSFFFFFCVIILLDILFSAGSFGRFLLYFSFEAILVSSIWLFLSNARKRKRDKSKRTGKKTGQIKFSEIIISPNAGYNTKQVDSSISKLNNSNFNWVINDDIINMDIAQKEVEKLEKVQVRDIKAEVANWSERVRYSGAVYESIKQRIYQSAISEEDSIPENEINFPSEECLEKNQNGESPIQEMVIEDAKFTSFEISSEIVNEDNITLENEADDEMSFQNSEGAEDSTVIDDTEDAVVTDSDEEVQDYIDEPHAEYLTAPELPEKGKRFVVSGYYKGNVRLFKKVSEAVIEQIPMEFPCEGVAENTEDLDDTVKIPPLELLVKSHTIKDERSAGYNHEETATKLIDTLASFGVGAKILNITQGPAVTRYEIQPDYGVKVSKIVNLTDDIALNLAATGVRIEAPIPGKAAIGIEIPNKEVNPVLLRDVIDSEEFMNHPSKLAFAVGIDISGNVLIADIAKMPHLLIAGATGSGKSVCINTLISSILYKASPSEVKLLMIDPKVVELSVYNGIPHLLIPVVTDPKKAAGALNWAVGEMTSRYKLFAENNVRDLHGYNLLILGKGEGKLLPQIVIIIDELADLMMVAQNDVEDCICRLAQMARAAGMHLVIATQRPSVDVITGVIKANIPSRISFAVSSQIDSRTILDMAGAEKLLGRGDMLFSPLGMSKPVRVQGGLITDKEVESIVSYIKSVETTQYDEDVLDKIEKQAGSSQKNDRDIDELLPQIVDMVIEQGMASTSLIQRKFKLGYSRAARILDQMEQNGIVGPFEGSKPRKVLVTKQEWQEMSEYLI